MREPDHIVYLIDDDVRVRESVSDLLEAKGFNVRAFAMATEYLLFVRPDLPACIILDVDLPGINGLEFQEQLSGEDHSPVVFITGHGDIPSSVRAMKLGAVDFLAKPFRDADLISAIRTGIERDREIRRSKAELSVLRAYFEELTPREREVLPLIVSGLLNKQAAAELGISEVTYQIHRSKVMQKMQAKSLADLVRIAGKLQIPILQRR